MKATQLETLRDLLQDTRSWVELGIVEGVAFASDRSVCRAKVRVFPDGREIIARVGVGAVGPDSGIHGPVLVNDMVVMAIPSGDEDNAVIISRLPSKEDTIPKQVVQGHTVIKSLQEKKLYLASLQKILIGAGGDTDPDEPLVLGNVLQTALSELISYVVDLSDIYALHYHVGNLGVATSPANNATDAVTLGVDLETLKASPIDDGEMLSDLAFTEKGE